MLNQKCCQVLADNKIAYSGHLFCKLSANVSKETLSTLIQRRLTELNIKKAELARRSGFSRTYITDLANETGNTQSGSYNLPPDTVTKLAKALEVDEIEILNSMGYDAKEEKDSEKAALLRSLEEISSEEKPRLYRQIRALIKAAKEEEQLKNVNN